MNKAMPKPRQWEKGFSEEEAIRALNTPVGFAQGYLGLNLYPWQKQVLTWYADVNKRTRGAVAANNGSGKSAYIIAVLSLWCVSMFRRGTVVITSKDSRQIDHQIWPAIARHSDKFPTFSFIKRNVRNNTGGEIILYTTDEQGRAEGYHRELPDKPVIMIFDEAKSIEDRFFEASDRCTFTGHLMISSTGYCQGRFYDAFHSMRDQYLTRTVTIEETPHVDQERIADIVRTYGEEHPFTRSTLYSEFMPEDEGNKFFFHKQKLEQVIENPPDFRPSNRICFCDFAGGGDENTLVLRDGNRVELVRCWREANEMAAIGQFIREFRRLDLHADEIWADAAGAGKVMCSRFEEQGWFIRRFNGCERAFNENEYQNRNAEIWDQAAKLINDGQIILPNDEKMVGQLLSRKRSGKLGMQDSRGRLTIESKEDMRSRGIKSPDRGDGVTFVVANMRPVDVKSIEIIPGWMEDGAGEYFDDEYFGVHGAHAG